MALVVLMGTLPRVPVVQTWLGNQVEALLGDVLGTEVSVGRVDLGFLTRIIIDDVVVKDQQHQDMLRVNRLSAKLDLLEMTEGRLSVSSAQLFGAKVSLYKPDSLSKTNFQFVVDSLSSTDTLSHTPLDLHVNSLIIRHSSVAYHQHDVPETPGQFNMQHLNFSDISAHVILKTLTDDSLRVNVKRLALKEQAGLNVERLSFLLDAGRSKASLTDFLLQLPGTHLRVGHMNATYDADKLKETLFLESEVSDAVVTPSDFSFLLPQLSAYAVPIALNVAFSGNLDNLVVSQFRLKGENDYFDLNTWGWVSLFPSPIAWNMQIEQLSAGNALLAQLQKDIDGAPELMQRLGYLQLKGDCSGNLGGELSTDCRLATGAGTVDVSFQATHNHQLKGSVDINGFSLQKLFDNQQLGQLSTHLALSGVPSDIKMTGAVTQIDWKGYSYQNIAFESSLTNGTVSGNLKIDDPNVGTDVEYQWKQLPRGMAVRLTGDVNHFSPAALHLSDKWGAATFSAIVDADFTASSLDDAQGSIDIDDFRLVDSIGTFFVENVHVKSGLEGEKRVFKVDSDMGEAELKGKFDWNTLPQSIVNYVADKLPTLPGLPSATNTVSNDFEISVKITDSEWVRRLLKLPLRLDNGLRLLASVNDNTHEVSLLGQVPSLTYGNNHYEEARIMITSPGDSMKCDLQLTKQMEDGSHVAFRVEAAAADNNLQTSLGWNNYLTGEHLMKGQLNAVAQLYMGTRGAPEAHISLNPSRLVVAGAEWTVSSNDVYYSAKNLDVRQFAVSHGEQHLIVNGRASESYADTLTIDLSDVEVAYVLNLVNFDAVEFSGGATGTVSVAGLFGNMAAWGNLTVSDFCFQRGRLGTLRAQAEWNEAEQQIDIVAVADEGSDVATYISGYVSPVREYLDLAIRGKGTNVEFMNSFTESFLSDVNGHAYGEVRLGGPLDALNLSGKLSVEGEATVTSLGTTYRLVGDTVVFRPDTILLDRLRLLDRYDNVAYASGGIFHENLSSLSFNLNVNTSRLLAYDFTDFGDMSFYGTVFARGDVALRGRPGEVVIDCDVTPLRGTTFTYNVVSADAISDQEFITWHDATLKDTVSLRGGTAVTEKEDDDQPTDIRINFIVNTTPESQVRLLMDDKSNDYVTLYGSGNITASFYNKGAFLMNGTYTVDRGTYGITIQNIIKKNFTFEEGGTVTFHGEPMNAELDLQAVYTVNSVPLSDLSIGNSFTSNNIRVNCLMNISGTANSPRVDFDLDMPTVDSEEKQMVRSIISTEQETNQQVLYLLAVGRFYTQGVNNADAQQYDRTTLAMQSFLSGTVSTQLTEVLSQVIKSNDWSIGANISTGNEGWHNAEYEGLVSGRMLNNRLLINGQFGYRDNATQATSSFIGDFDVRYLLLPNGNLALKVYNQTNDRYFTRSALNTQGVGLIMKKDFNSLRDLFGLRRKSKKEE